MTVTEREREVLAEYVKARLAGGAAPPSSPCGEATRVTMRASPGELHVDDEAWHPEQPTGEGAPAPSLDEGEVTIALERRRGRGPGRPAQGCHGACRPRPAARRSASWPRPPPRPVSPRSPRSPPAPITRAIPSSGEKLPVVGLGSWITFNVGDDPELRDECAAVMRAFFGAGGRMIDSSPMYGSSQEVIGYGLGQARQAVALFSADKVWTSSGSRGPEQIEESRSALGRAGGSICSRCTTFSHGRTICPTLFAMKAEGRLRYVGITTSEGRRHGEIEQIMASRPIDFVQVTYNVLDREVEERILPLAQDRGIAVIVNRPFRQGALIRRGRAPSPALLGRGDRRGQLGAVPSQVHRLPSRGHLRDPGDQPGRARGREHGRRVRPAARCGHAPADGRARRGALMPEWWTYALSDFLLFSPRTYYRLIERHNAAVWPAQIVTLGLGLGIAGAAAPAGAAAGTHRLRHPGRAVGLGGVGVRLAALRHHQLGGGLPRLAVRDRGRCCWSGSASIRGRLSIPVGGGMRPAILGIGAAHPVAAALPGARAARWAAAGGRRRSSGSPRIRR